MIKLLGALLIVIATTWAGFKTSSRFNERPRQLRYLKSALQILESEIMFGHVPLGDAVKRIAGQVPKPISLLFEIFSEKLASTHAFVPFVWKESLDEMWQWTALQQGEYDALCQFGETLGRHDRISQQKQILLVMSHLDREEQDAIEMQSKYEKMVKSLGFLLGMLIIILLI